MAFLPIIAVGIWVSLTDQNQMIIFWTSLAALIATLDSYLYEKIFIPKVPQNNNTVSPNIAQAIPTHDSSTFVTSIIIYLFSLSILLGILYYFIIGTQNTTPQLPSQSVVSSEVIQQTNDGSDIPEAPTESWEVMDNRSESGWLTETGVLTDMVGLTESWSTEWETWMKPELDALWTPEEANTLATVEWPKQNTQGNVKEKIIYSEEPFWEPNGEWEAGLNDLIARWYLRKATESDHDAWFEAMFNSPDSYITIDIGYPVPEEDKKTIRAKFNTEMWGKEYYVALKNFTLPSGMFWKYNFYIPKGIKKPQGNISNGAIFDYNTLECVMCHEAFWSKKSTSSTAQTANFDANTVYLAWGAYGGKQTDKQIDSSGHAATLFDVFVNSPKKTVVLILGAYEPSIWSVRVSEGTVIKKVILWGYNGQEVMGISKNIPVEKHVYIDGKSSDYFYISEGSTLVSSLKKYGNVETITYADKESQVSLGEPITGKEKWTTDPSIKIEDFYNTSEELAWEAGLDALIQKWVLRKATQEDYEAWADAVVNAPNTYVTKQTGYPIKPDQLESTKTKIISSFRGPSMYYVALKEFTLPGGMYWKFWFLIPKGISVPKGSVSNWVLYDFNTLGCTGFCNFQ